MGTDTEHLKILGLPKDASDADINKAYRKLLMQWHPDKNKSPDAKEKVREIQAAYNALSSRTVVKNTTFTIPLSEPTEIPNQPAYRFIDEKKTIHFIPRDKYFEFIQDVHHTLPTTCRLQMDLVHAEVHGVVLDISFSRSGLMENFVEVVLRPILDSLFPGCFTMICAKKVLNLHVHLPEFVIGHDDYILFCTELKKNVDSEFAKLQIPKFFDLPSDQCRPFAVHYVDKVCSSLNLEASKFNASKIACYNKFRYKLANTNTVFREIEKMTYSLTMQKCKFYMMPVVMKDETTKTSYETKIGTKDGCKRKVATFKLKSSRGGESEITKSIRLYFDGNGFNRACQYIKQNALRMVDFKSDNHAYNTWYDKHKSNVSVIHDIFEDINQIIVDDNDLFATDPHPLRTILEYDNGYFFKPVFFALCHHMKRPPIDELRNVLDTSPYMESLLDELSKINKSILMEISSDFSINTILYCGSNMFDRVAAFNDKMHEILTQSKPIIDSCTTTTDLIMVIKKLMDRFTPVITANLKNSCKKPTMYMWNIVQEQWQEVLNEKQISNLVTTIHLNIGMLYDNVEGIKCPIPSIVAAISSESNMDRVTIGMDQHKWSLKTPNGVLDLLTGHVGGTVPEFYLSDNTISVELERQEIIELRNNPDLLELYKLLFDRKFLNEYLQALHEDESDDFFDALKIVTLKHGVFFNNNNLALSMLNFYIHLCKFVSFEFDLLITLIDVLSSTLVSTNYYRHFFIMQGETGNGKSKLFEILQRVFGTYCAFIRNVNVQSSTNFATHPELATHLFNKRIIQIEELSGKINENLIKELTGNSKTSFRSLYEQNVGGIPTAKIFTTTNNPPNCTATQAFEERVMTFPFDSKFVKHLSDKRTSVQVENDIYQGTMSDNIVNDSYLGLFSIIYLNWMERFNRATGFLELKPEPPIMLEFKEHYLSTTSMYNQFKQFADIQIVTGETTTFTDLISAIRQFLNETRRVNVNEDDIVNKFEDEFAAHKKTETEDECLSSSAMEDEDGPPAAKKMKMDTMIIYKDIAIRNLKKKFNPC